MVSPLTVSLFCKTESPDTSNAPFKLTSTRDALPNTDNFPVKSVSPATAKFLLRLASKPKNKLEFKETSPSINKRLFMETSFTKSTSVTTPPIIALPSILLSGNATRLLNDTSPKLA